MQWMDVSMHCALYYVLSTALGDGRCTRLGDTYLADR
jgi:hypothetical protein